MAAESIFDSISFEAYLSLDEASDERLELFRGRVYTMMAVGGRHVVVQANLAGICINGLRGRPCRFSGENAKVHVERKGSGYHPDGTIACPLRFSNERMGVIENPQVVFEILSPGTERFDRTEKWDDYATVESVREIVLIETERARVEVYERRDDGWLKRVYLAGTSAFVPSVGIEIPLDELYEDAAFPEEGPVTPSAEA